MSTVTESNATAVRRRGALRADLAANGVSVRGLTKSFRRRSGEIVHAIDHVDLDVVPGELLVLLGPSGCGKTTLMRCIAGLETPDEGKIWIDDVPVFDDAAKLDLPANRRAAGMVFQSYALWPHMSVFQNVAYPLRNQKLGRAEVKTRVDEILATVGVSDLTNSYPAQLSGGQQQRVSLARAIVAGDDVVLFDEPLSNVDAKVRDRLRLEIQQMQHKLGFTALYVTHDQEEAMTLGTRIAVLQEGKIAQLGTPRDVYSNPTSHYVANFIGAANEIAGDITRSVDDRTTVATALGEIHGIAPATITGTGARVLIRPEALQVSDGSSGVQANVFTGTVIECAFLGGRRLEYIVDCGAHTLRAWAQDGARELATGTQVTLQCEAQDVLVFGAA